MSQPDFQDFAAKPVNRSIIGCAVQSMLIAAAMLGGAVWLLGRCSSIDGLLRTAAIVLSIFGSLLLIPLGLYLMTVLAKWYLKKRFVRPFKESMSSARKTSEMTKKLYGPRHIYRQASEVDFAGLDGGWYESVTAELMSLGYRHLADRVNETVEEAAGVTVVMRKFVFVTGRPWRLCISS